MTKHAPSPGHAPGSASNTTPPGDFIDTRIRADLEALGQESQRALGSPGSLLDLVVAAENKPNTSNNPKKGFFMSPRTSKIHRLRLGLAAACVVLAVTGAVAATQTSWFSISVDTEGKSDQEVADEVHDQLIQQGMDNAAVTFERQGEGSRLDIEATHQGKGFVLRRLSSGDEGTNMIHVQPPALDTEREPGMTDEQLAAKIRAQLDGLGMANHEVIVEGNRIEIRAEHSEEVEE